MSKKRHIVFLTTAEKNSVQNALSYMEAAYDSGGLDGEAIEGEEGKKPPKSLDTAWQKVYHSPTITRDNLMWLEHTMGNSWESDEDYECIIPSARRRHATMDAWDRIIKAFRK